MLEAIFNEPGHAALATRYRGFDPIGDRWKAPAPAASPTAVG